MVQNPLCKAYASDMVWLMTAESIQCHGGYGYMEEYAPASLARDCKIYSIWEGTSFIQSNDLVGRKFTMKKGEPFKKWLAAIQDFIADKKTPEFAAEFAMMEDAFASYKEILDVNASWKSSRPELSPFRHPDTTCNCHALLRQTLTGTGFAGFPETGGSRRRTL